MSSGWSPDPRSIDSERWRRPINSHRKHPRNRWPCGWSMHHVIYLVFLLLLLHIRSKAALPMAITLVRPPRPVAPLDPRCSGVCGLSITTSYHVTVAPNYFWPHGVLSLVAVMWHEVIMDDTIAPNDCSKNRWGAVFCSKWSLCRWDGGTVTVHGLRLADIYSVLPLSRHNVHLFLQCNASVFHWTLCAW